MALFHLHAGNVISDDLKWHKDSSFSTGYHIYRQTKTSGKQVLWDNLVHLLKTDGLRAALRTQKT